MYLRSSAIDRAGWLASSLAGWLARWLAGWLASWLAGRLAGWLASSLAGWLTGWRAGSLAGWTSRSADPHPQNRANGTSKFRAIVELEHFKKVRMPLRFHSFSQKSANVLRIFIVFTKNEQNAKGILQIHEMWKFYYWQSAPTKMSNPHLQNGSVGRPSRGRISYLLRRPEVKSAGHLWWTPTQLIGNWTHRQIHSLLLVLRSRHIASSTHEPTLIKSVSIILKKVVPR